MWQDPQEMVIVAIILRLFPLSALATFPYWWISHTSVKSLIKSLQV